MSTVTENDLQEIKELIKELAKAQHELEKSQVRIEAKLDGFDKRLENIGFVIRFIFGSLLTGLLLAIAKYLFPNLLS